MIQNLCVFCGSSPGRDERYAGAALQLGHLLATEGIRLVYGGGRVGLMGVLADAVLAGGAPPVRPRGVVARSWSRVLGLGLDASRTNAREPLTFAEVERRRRQSPLSLVIDELRQVLVS
ncbi:MAG: hypothetical protein KY464_09905, partial [Gemmatimonadetes bacterium]|nr:hypothetical protein [Gemmatimonadota bacterium]